MEACAIATKFHSIALQTHPLSKSKLSVKPKTQLFCKSSLIILSKFSASPAHQTWPRSYAYANTCSCSNNTNSFAVQADTEAGHDRTVRVKLILQKECEFGEDFCVVGEEPILGSWDPQLALPMTWSSDHIWTTPTMDIPLGKRIYFKFILRDKEGEIHWQPGPDRVLETWETRTTLLVSQDWYDFDLQTITEAETEEKAIRETLGETDIEDQVVRATKEEITETGARIVERGEISEGVPVLVPGLTSVSYTAGDCSLTGKVSELNNVLSADIDCLTKEIEDPQQSPLNISAAQGVEQQHQQQQNQQQESSSYFENQVVTTTKEEIAETRARIVERGNINKGVPVLVPGLTSVSYTAGDCSSTGKVPELNNELSADIDCLTKEVEYPRQSPLAIWAAQEVEQQHQQQKHQQQESSSYVENGSVMCNNHVSPSGEDEALTSVATEISVGVEKEETSTSNANELIENENAVASSESSCNEEEHSSTIEYESDSSVLQKDFDWGRAALSKLIWSLGLKND